MVGDWGIAGGTDLIRRSRIERKTYLKSMRLAIVTEVTISKRTGCGKQRSGSY
jgi:hypothetical protein